MALRYTSRNASLLHRAALAVQNQINSAFPSLIAPNTAISSDSTAATPRSALDLISPTIIQQKLWSIEPNVGQHISGIGSSSSNNLFEELSTWLISTLKRRKKKMNKHKLRKRRKLLRLKNKKWTDTCMEYKNKEEIICAKALLHYWECHLVPNHQEING